MEAAAASCPASSQILLLFPNWINYDDYAPTGETDGEGELDDVPWGGGVAPGQDPARSQVDPEAGSDQRRAGQDAAAPAGPERQLGGRRSVLARLRGPRHAGGTGPGRSLFRR